MRVATYARYSTDRQKQTSIEDQLRAAHARAAAEGWQIVIERSDDAVSGATPFALRPGSKALLADALAARFDVLIVEGLDRSFRDVGEQEQIVKRLEHRGIRIIGTADGYDTNARGRKVMRIARGMINELYLDDLREKVHRGLAGQFDRGMSAGGRSYGYRSEQTAHGYRLVIDEAQAEVVRWIFECFVEGWAPMTIAHELNRRGIPSPRGGTWASSALHGSAARGLGLLHNELYAGRVIWNRRQWLKDPETGKRRYVERPEGEWQVRDQPELAIIDPQTWARSRLRAAGQKRHGTGTAETKKGGRPHRSLFAGLLRCPVCGGPMVAIDARRYGCSIRKERGEAACANRDTALRNAVDTRLVGLLREELLHPEAMADLHGEVLRLSAERTRGAGAAAVSAKARLAELQAEIDRLVDAVATLGVSQALAARLKAAEAELASLQLETSAATTDTADQVMDRALSRYRGLLADVQKRLESTSDMARTREIVAQILGPITLLKDDEGVTWAQMQNPAEQLIAVGGGPLLTVVAEARFELATFGL